MFLLVSKRVEVSFVCIWEELLGVCFEDLLSERYGGVRVKNCSKYSFHPLIRSRRSGLDPYAIRLSDSKFTVDVSIPLAIRELEY